MTVITLGFDLRLWNIKLANMMPQHVYFFTFNLMFISSSFVLVIFFKVIHIISAKRWNMSEVETLYGLNH